MFAVCTPGCRSAAFAGHRLAPGWRALVVIACCLAPLPSPARVEAQGEPVFDVAPLGARRVGAPPVQPPLRLSAVPLRIDNKPAASPSHSGDIANPPLRTAGPDTPALDAEVARLRATALATPARGAPGSRAQANAAWLMGLLYVHGIGVTTDLAQAASWFERAQAGGEPLAAAGLAWCEIEGCRNTPNPAAANRWITALRSSLAGRALYLQWLMESRLQPLQIASPPVAAATQAAPVGGPDRQLLVAAARAGDTQARIELGLESLAAGREAEAISYFRSAAGQSAAAAANLARLTDSARRPQAGTSAPSSNASDTLALAQRNHRGDGRPANFVEAIRLYRQAQSQGSVPAKKMLELIFSRPGPDGQIDIGWMQQLAYVQFSSDGTTFDSRAQRQLALRRDPTPLFDLLPLYWRQQVLHAPR